jgi:hypothetical protein
LIHRLAMVARKKMEKNLSCCILIDRKRLIKDARRVLHIFSISTSCQRQESGCHNLNRRRAAAPIIGS